jgi:hypothetical protein
MLVKMQMVRVRLLLREDDSNFLFLGGGGGHIHAHPFLVVTRRHVCPLMSKSVRDTAASVSSKWGQLAEHLCVEKFLLCLLCRREISVQHALAGLGHPVLVPNMNHVYRFRERQLGHGTFRDGRTVSLHVSGQQVYLHSDCICLGSFGLDGSRPICIRGCRLGT